MDKIFATDFCDRFDATLNGLAGTNRFEAVSTPRTATMHTANDWEKIAFSIESPEHFNSGVAMGIFVRLLVIFGFKVYETMSPKSKHYVLLLPSEDGRYPGFLLSSRYDIGDGFSRMSVRAQLLNDDPQRNILGNIGGNLFFCTKRGNSVNGLSQIPSFNTRD